MSALVASDHSFKYGVKARRTVNRTLLGYSAEMTPAQARAVASDPAVACVEENAIGRKTAWQSPVPSWGIDRIDQKFNPLDHVYSYRHDGSGVHAYIVDSGVDPQHPEFTGRIGNGVNTILGEDPNDTYDCD